MVSKLVMKSVAIVGAGPAGLVSAKTLLHSYPNTFQVTIIEKQDRIGGLWAVDQSTQTKMLNPGMPTNLSKHTVTFSDHAWDSVDLYKNEAGKVSFVPTFPKAWQVGRYLQAYAEKNIPSDAFRFNCKVDKVVRNEKNASSQWTLTMAEKGSKSEENFDFVIVASGIFAKAHLPESLLRDDYISSSRSANARKMIHSTDLRTVSDVVPENWDGEGDLLVVGGGMSGAEAAANLAFQLSTMRSTPGGSKTTNQTKVIHITSHSFYIAPQFLPLDTDSETPSFVPLDVASYKLDFKPSGPVKAAYGIQTPQAARMRHQMLRRNFGGDQSELQTSALISENLAQPPFIATTIGRRYYEFVRSGDIVPIKGRVINIRASKNPNTPMTAVTMETRKGANALTNIAGGVLATGFEAQHAIEYLDDDTKQALEYDKESNRLPLILNKFQTGHPSVPGLGFVGFYEGPYWAVVEAQAKLIASQWASEYQHQQIQDKSDAQRQEEDFKKLSNLRQSMKAKDPWVPQLWNNDFAGLVEEISDLLGIQRNDDGFGVRKGLPSPARYLGNNHDEAEANRVLINLKDTLQQAERKGLFVPAVVFFSLQGHWKFNRTLNSALDSFPSGTVTGTASYSPRDPTNAEYDQEYLYSETGDFVTDTGAVMHTTRKYVDRYNEERDEISVWFVKDDSFTVDYQFHILDLQDRNAEDAAKPHTWIAKGYHLCEPDEYRTRYEFRFRGPMVERFNVRHEVKGPKKEYVSDTWYDR